MSRSNWISVGLALAACVLFFVGWFSGPAALSWSDHWSALVQGDGMLLAACSGSALALSGLLMQAYFKNPLAGPSVLGVTSGSTLGVALVSLGGLAMGQPFGIAGTVVGALLGAWGVMVLLGGVIGWFRSRSALLIFGLMVGYLSGAMVTVLQAGADAGAL